MEYKYLQIKIKIFSNKIIIFCAKKFFFHIVFFIFYFFTFEKTTLNIFFAKFSFVMQSKKMKKFMSF